jgi:nucleoside-diphosphate-sugar epimerase
MTTASTPPLHVIFGAGQIGRLLAEQLLEAGHEVRLCRRSAPGPSAERLTWMQGDATDVAFADEACRGAAVVYNCANPPDYAGWDGVIQPLFTAIWQAAGRAGARLVALDNLYGYGRPAAAPFDEDTPQQPCSDKGAIRADLAAELLAAHGRGEVDACLGRASDFFGPNTQLSAIFSPRFFERLAAGKSVEAFGDPDMPHAYSYTVDVARGLAALGAHPEAAGKVWHLPVAWKGTTRELMQHFASAVGQPLNVRVMPGWLMTLVSFIPIVGAMREMVYQWEVPYVPDDARFKEAFNLEATPIDEAVRNTLRGSA